MLGWLHYGYRRNTSRARGHNLDQITYLAHSSDVQSQEGGDESLSSRL